MNAWYRAVGKRLCDVTLALFGAGVFCPILSALWVLIPWTSPGPAVLRQVRVGRRGQPFTLLKFRSMTSDGVAVTRLGRCLRATALDELPQLIHILRGQMSFVGPRPLVPEEAKLLATVPEGQARLRVLPGLAGLTQLYAGKHPDPAARLKMDLAYAAAQGFWLDCWIVCCAVATSVRGRWDPAP